MSISRLYATVTFLSLFGIALVSLHCGPGASCVRISDCDDGMTCSRGTCQPLVQDDAASGVSSSGASTEAGATGNGSSTSNEIADAAADADAAASAEATDGAASADASDD